MAMTVQQRDWQCSDKERHARNREATKAYRQNLPEAEKRRRAELKRAWREKNIDHVRAYHTKYKADHKSEIKAQRARPATKAKRNRAAVLRVYRMTLEEYDAMLAAQGGGCAICGSPGGTGYSLRLQVDHDHTTEEVRGLLCGPCNKALGMLSDDPEKLQRAVDYLKKFNAAKKYRLIGVCP